MATIDLASHMKPSRYDDEPDRWNLADAAILVMDSRYVRHEVRFGVSYQGPGGTVRTESHLDEQAGPYGWLVPHSTVITSQRIPGPRLSVRIQEHDVLVVNGQRMVVLDDREMHYPRLVTEAEAAALAILRQIRDQLAESYRGQPGTEEANARRNERQAVLTGLTKLISDQLPQLRTRYAAQLAR